MGELRVRTCCLHSNPERTRTRVRTPSKEARNRRRHFGANKTAQTMDTFAHQSSSSLFSGGSFEDSVFSFLPSSTEDIIMEPGLWSGREGEGANEAFLGSLESGGVLLNPGSWTISTSPGEGLRWNGVGKTELFDEWAGQASCALNKQTTTDIKCGRSTLTKQPSKIIKTSPTPMQLLSNIKADPENSWTSSVATLGASGSGSPGAGEYVSPSPAVSALNSPPITLRGLGYVSERVSQKLQSSTGGAAGAHLSVAASTWFIHSDVFATKVWQPNFAAVYTTPHCCTGRSLSFVVRGTLLIDTTGSTSSISTI